MDADYCRLQKDEETYEVNDLMEVVSHCEYDLNGNPVREGDTCYYYDALDRLIEIRTPDKQILFTYDFDHRRLSKTVCQRGKEIVTYFLYDGLKEVGATDSKGNITELRILKPSDSSEIGSAVALEMGDKVYAPLHDLSGNVRLLVAKDSGRIESSYTYTVFGEGQSIGTVSNSWRFFSKRLDEESGLVYFGKRYYSPKLGRWLTPDPAESSENLYAFVNNNPLLYADSFGLYTTDRVSDAHFFDRNHPNTSNFSIGLIGDVDLGTIHYHSGINNSYDDVIVSQEKLYKIFQGQHAVNGHWIHNNYLLYGLSLVASEKMTRSRFCCAAIPGLTQLGMLRMATSHLQAVIDYEIELLSTQAEQIRSENNPRLKQLHVLFSNASYPFREALIALTPEQRDTVIAISLGPTTLIERNLAHRVFNVIGERDWPSRMCHGIFVDSLQNKSEFDVQVIPQSETKFGVFGHYFEQREYQKYINKIVEEGIKSKYEIY